MTSDTVAENSAAVSDAGVTAVIGAGGCRRFIQTDQNGASAIALTVLYINDA